MSRNFFILSGGPGAGKTTVLQELRRRGFRCVDDVAREILREQQASGGNLGDSGDPIAFLALMLERSIAAYEAARLGGTVTFFDRGIPELVGYCEYIGCAVPGGLRLAIEQLRYNPRVFIFPPWPEIYVVDSERTQSYDHSVRAHDASVRAHQECGYFVEVVAPAPMEARTDFILQMALG